MLFSPFYQDEFVTIYHGDCAEILPIIDPVDLLLTDPPYGINVAGKKDGKVGSGGKVKGSNSYALSTSFGQSDWDKAIPSEQVFDLMGKISTTQIIFGGNYFPLPPSSCWLVWDKDNAGTDFADCELAWTNKKSAVRKFKWRWNGMLQEDMRRKEIRQHPTQKPLPLMKWCIGQVPDAKTILDPFMGSGTTLCAAKDLGLKAIGIEREKKYCEIAVQRLKQESLFGLIR
jgi:DNA modification methylase